MSAEKGKKSELYRRKVEPLPGRRYKKPLPVELEDAEVLTLSDAAGKLNKKIKKEELELAEASTTAKTSIKEKKQRLNTMLDQLTTRSKEVETSCVELPNFDENAVEVVREDTGIIVDIRPMRAEDRQKDLGVKDPKPKN